VNKITFSSDKIGPTYKDFIETAKLAESYFKTKQNKTQIETSRKNSLWAYKKIPNSLNIIRNDRKIIGFVWIIPCSKSLMNKFLRKKISEAKLFKKLQEQKIDEDNFESLYLCSSFIIPEYRRKGLATKAAIKTIRKLTQKRKIKPILFSWPYSKEGKLTILKAKNTINIKLR